MAETKEQQQRSAAADSQSRPISLVGDSAELIAFGLLRSIAQIEQKQDNIRVDRAWLLDAYAECLLAAQGKRQVSSSAATVRSAKKK